MWSNSMRNGLARDSKISMKLWGCHASSTWITYCMPNTAWQEHNEEHESFSMQQQVGIALSQLVASRHMQSTCNGAQIKDLSEKAHTTCCPNLGCAHRTRSSASGTHWATESILSRLEWRGRRPPMRFRTANPQHKAEGRVGGWRLLGQLHALRGPPNIFVPPAQGRGRSPGDSWENFVPRRFPSKLCLSQHTKLPQEFPAPPFRLMPFPKEASKLVGKLCSSRGCVPPAPQPCSVTRLRNHAPPPT